MPSNANAEQLTRESSDQRRGFENPAAAAAANAVAQIRAGCRTLKSAPIFWARKNLLVELRRLRRLNYDGVTIGAVLGQETEQSRLEDPFCRVLDILRRDVLDMLCRGDLEAYGFVDGDDPSVDRKLIHQGRWRVLRPDFANCTAEGAGIRLVDVVVRPPVTTKSFGAGAGKLADQDRPVRPRQRGGRQQHQIGRVVVGPIVPAQPAGGGAAAQAIHQGSPIALVSQIDQPSLISPPSPTALSEGDAEVRPTLVLSTRSRTLKHSSGSIRLSSAAVQLMKLLMEQTSIGVDVVSNAQIVDLYSPGTAAGTIRWYICSLRKALSHAGLQAEDGSDLILNHNRVGYSLALTPKAISVE